jgi:hypothetical protein
MITSSRRVEFEPAADAPLSRDMGTARAEKRVDDDVAAIGEVEQRILEYRGRLDSRVVLQPTAAA